MPFSGDCSFSLQKGGKMEDRLNINTIAKIIERGRSGDVVALADSLSLCKALETKGSALVAGKKDGAKRVFDKANFKAAHDLNKGLRTYATRLVKETGNKTALNVVKDSLLFDAPHDFDAFCRYIEWERDSDKSFYLPRRKQLLPMVKQLQRLADNELDLLAISCPPGIGKTELAIFFLCFIGGRNPELSILGGSHSNSFLRGVYDEILRIIEGNGEYLWKDVFPEVDLVGTNSKDLRLDLGKRKRFETFEFSSTGSGNAGKVRASNLLYCDDLIADFETAASPERLEKLWQQYTVDLRQRKIGKCKELHIATHWSTQDVIARLEREHENNKRAKFIAFPATDENGKSLWDYPHSLGFTTEFFERQKEMMDDVMYQAIYMNSPIEREGVLFERESLRRYFTLPDREPDAIIAVCDTKNKGTDYCVLPIAYQYGNDFFIEKIVCDNRTPDIVEPELVNALVKYNVQMAQFESNAAGGRIAEDIQKAVVKENGITHITTKWNQTNKETRILSDCGFIKNHFLFRDDSTLSNDPQYKTALRLLTSYSSIGKNKFDDVPDALSMLARFVRSNETNTVSVFRRPF